MACLRSTILHLEKKEMKRKKKTFLLIIFSFRRGSVFNAVPYCNYWTNCICYDEEDGEARFKFGMKMKCVCLNLTLKTPAK